MAGENKLAPVQWAALGFGLAAVAGIIWAAVTFQAGIVDDPRQLYSFIKLSVAIVVMAFALTGMFYLVSETSGTENELRWERFWQAIKFRPVITLIVLFLGAVVIVSIWYNGYQGILDQLDEWLTQPGEFIRSIITTFVVLATVTIAVALVGFLLFHPKEKEEDLEFWKFRITGAKEVLSIFVGILGTIMGFYYGSGKVTPKEVTTIQQSSMQDSGGSAATNAIENKAFDLLIKKNYDDAVKAFDLLSKATPPSPNAANIDAISKLLLDPTNADKFKSSDETTKNAAWAELYCKIFTGKMAANMSKETRDKFESGCNAAAKGPSPSPNPKPSPT